jgi:hypothetical protein
MISERQAGQPGLPPPPPSTEIGGSNDTCDPTKELCNPIKYPSIPCLFKAILEIAAQIGSVFIILGFIYSGFLFVSARGNEEELAKAKRAITYTVIGAIIVLGAWAFSVGIANTINTIVNGTGGGELCP